MLIGYKRGQGSIVLRVKILNSSVSTGAGLTGLTSASTGLIISTIADNEATATAYTVAGSTIETITTLGTYAAPTATKCRFKEVDATNHKGVYEIQIADARYAVSSAKSLLISLSGATNAAETDVVIPLRDLDPYDSVRAGLTALPNAAAGANGGLPLGDASGRVDIGKILGTASAGAVGYVGVDWGAITNKTTTNALTGTTIATTQKVDVETIKTNPVVNAGTITFPTGATLASTTNITAATGIVLSGVTHTGAVIPTVTTVTNQLTAAQIATGIWQDTTAGDFTVASSIGKSLYTSGAVPGATGGLFIAGSNAATTVNITGNITGNVSGSVGSVTGAVGSVTGNVGGNVVGSVASVTLLAANAIAIGSIASNAIDATALATTATDEIRDALFSTAATKLTIDASGRVDVSKIGGDTATVTNMVRTFRALIIDTCTTGSSTTSVKPANLVGTVADQYKGRILTFRDDTTTAALRGQQTDITASSLATPTTLTVTALTTAPASTDSFTIN